MIVVLNDGVLFNLDNVNLVDPEGFRGKVKVHTSSGDFSFDMDRDQYRAMIQAYQDGEKVFSLFEKQAIDTNKIGSKFDYKDFPSVLQGENSPF